MKLKPIELALIFALVITVLFSTSLSAEADGLSSKLIRLHVVADSDSDEEHPAVVGVLAARALNSIDGMSARVVTDGVIAVKDKEYTIDGIRDFVDNYFCEGALGCTNIEFSHSNGDTAYFVVEA